MKISYYEEQVRNATAVAETPNGAPAMLQVDSDGKLKVDLGGASLSLAGNVNISNEVEIKNDAGNPIPVNVCDGSGNSIDSNIVGNFIPDAHRGLVVSNRPSGNHTIVPSACSFVTLSSTIGTSNSVALAAPGGSLNRRYLFIQNQSNAHFFVNFANSAAGNTGIKLDAGAALTFEGSACTNQAINLCGSTAGQTYVIVWG